MYACAPCNNFDDFHLPLYIPGKNVGECWRSRESKRRAPSGGTNKRGTQTGRNDDTEEETTTLSENHVRQEEASTRGNTSCCLEIILPNTFLGMSVAVGGKHVLSTHRNFYEKSILIIKIFTLLHFLSL